MPASHKSCFPLLGEPLALDLVNTRVCRDGGEADLLDTPAALVDWLRAERGRVTWRGPVNVADWGAVGSLRDAIDRLLRAHRASVRPRHADLDTLNHALAAPIDEPRLCWSANGPALHLPLLSVQRAVLLRSLARNALALLTGPSATRVRECAHPECRLQFLATNPRRRWCSSALCGNRARVARHYQHHHPAG